MNWYTFTGNAPTEIQFVFVLRNDCFDIFPPRQTNNKLNIVVVYFLNCRLIIRTYQISFKKSLLWHSRFQRHELRKLPTIPRITRKTSWSSLNSNSNKFYQVKRCHRTLKGIIIIGRRFRWHRFAFHFCRSVLHSDWI
jgi:hypothetical protein